MYLLNQKMMDVIVSAGIINEADIRSKVDQFSNSVFSKIKLVDDHVIVVDLHDVINQGELDDRKIKQFFGGYTGFEASKNEMRITDYLDVDDGSDYILAKSLMVSLRNYLKEQFPQFHFCIILVCQGDETHLRFHRIRANETGWLDDNLDNYSEAILIEKS